MEFSVDAREGGVAVVHLSGRLDLVSAVEARQQLREVVEAGHHRLVVDLGEVAFIDSSGLGVLISTLKAARLAGGDLRIASPVEQARLVLRLTTLERVLRPYPSVEEALAGYA